MSNEDTIFLFLDDMSKSNDVPATITKKKLGIRRTAKSFIGPIVLDIRKRCN
jgi:hypothetical protein